MFFLRNSRAPNVASIHLSVHMRRCVFQICDDFHYPGARPPEVLISSIDFNDSHLRACLGVARCSRAMISNVSRTCRVHGAHAKYTSNRMVWRTHVSRPSACVAFGARRCWLAASRLGSPGPSRSPQNTAMRGVWCTRVSRTSVCVAFGARSRCHHVGPHRPNEKRNLKRQHTVIEAHLLRPNRPSPRPTSIINHPSHGQQQQSSQRSGRKCSVGGRAMHMEWPDGIGREAGNGKTRHVKELSLFRACPW